MPPTKARPVILPRPTNSAGYEEQLGAETQLDGVSGTFVLDRYLYRPAAGAGVTIYIVDTGVVIVRAYIPNRAFALSRYQISLECDQTPVIWSQ